MLPVASRNVVRLVDAQARQRDRVRDTVTAAVAELVAGWADFATPSQVRRLVDALVRLVEPAQSRTASTTSAYLARVIGELTGRPAAPVGVRIDPARLRGGTSHRDALERVAAEYRRHRADELDDQAARDRAVKRARLIVDEDLSLASREAARQVFTRTPGVTGYRRVIRPEKSAGGSCGLCVAASDRVYSRGDLLPLHALCKCEPLPIVGANDPGRSLNRDELDELYRRAGGNTAEKLKRARVTVHEHGELGPVLRDPGEHFRGPDEVAADTAA